MKNVYPALIIGFASCLITMPNRKLHIVAFHKLFHLVPTFLLLLSNDFQLSLPSFLKPLPNLHEAIAAFQLVLKSLMVLCALDPLYYTPAEMAATNKVIATTRLEFIVKATNNKNKHLRRYAVYLIDNLELLQSSYLTEHNLTLIASVVRFGASLYYR